MANYTATLSAVDKTLVASAVDVVTFDHDCDQVSVAADGIAKLYFTVDGSVPTVGGQNTYELPAAVSVRTVPVPTAGGTVVKLISAGTPTYTVEDGTGAQIGLVVAGPGPATSYPLASGTGNAQATSAAGRLLGFTIAETGGSAGATVRLYSGTDNTGVRLATVTLDINESVREWFGPQGIAVGASGVFVERVSGTSSVTVYQAA
jgi:hypothetical protein